MQKCNNAGLILISILGVVTCNSCSKVDKPLPPKASFSYDYSGYTVNFRSTSQTYGATSTMTWDFGDNTDLKMGESVSHPYGGSGSHYVTLTVSNAYGYSKYSENIEIKEEIAKISTRYGDMFIWLYNETFNHKTNFLHNAATLFYDSTTFHKIVPGDMIMGGDGFSKDNDPANDGKGGPVTLAPEFRSGLNNIYGALGSVRPPDNLDPAKYSNAWQFYIITNPAGYAPWDSNHTVFGYVMRGMDVAKKIESQPADNNGRPVSDIRMSVSILKLSKYEILENYGYKVK
jgi:cyclophilin family peptidyl-prolyl cis-trans isomerase